MGFLDLIEQHHTIRASPNCLGQLAAFIVANISGRCSDQPSDRVLLHVFRHIQPDHRSLVVKEELCESACQFGLADAGWSQEKERA